MTHPLPSDPTAAGALPPSCQAVVLFAHGSRDPLWSAPIEAVAQAIQHSRPDLVVSCAYLELTQPDLATVVSRLAAQGLQQLCIVPMFLGVGRHAREDLPQLLTVLSRQHPQLQLSLQPAVGENPRVVAALANAVVASLDV